MIVKTIIDEDFVNYKKPSMVVSFPNCTFKCDMECGQQVCQNSTLVALPNMNVEVHKLCERYLLNPITSAIVCSGLEPMESFEELFLFIKTLRYDFACNDDVVIYTGYTEEECLKNMWLQKLSSIGNIILKFGRFVPNQKSHYDAVLGVMLSSDNQYGKKIL